MLLRQSTLKAIAAGTVTLAFRRWRRPTVRAGGTLTTAVGVLAIDEVSPIDLADITEDEARAAGHEDLPSLRRALSQRATGTVYRIMFHRAGPDPRIALRQVLPDADELEQLRLRMARWDAASPTGSWTRAVLELLRDNPGVRAADLAEQAGMDKPRFKVNVRKLKGIGLTESLETGYRLSPRGTAFLAQVPPG